MTTRRFETLVEAWEHVRQPDHFGEEIAQQAVVETLSVPGGVERAPGYLLSRCHWLRIRRYSDATGEQRSDLLKYKKEVLATDPKLIKEKVDTLSPEKLLLIKEETLTLKEDAVQALLANYTPRSDPTKCARGHKGKVYYRHKSNGRVSKACHLCDSIMQKATRDKRKLAALREPLN